MAGQILPLLGLTIVGAVLGVVDVRWGIAPLLPDSPLELRVEKAHNPEATAVKLKGVPPALQS